MDRLEGYTGLGDGEGELATVKEKKKGRGGERTYIPLIIHVRPVSGRIDDVR